MGTRLCTFAGASGATLGAEGSGPSRDWFVGAVENFRFFDLNVYALADVQGGRPSQGEWLIKSTGRMYRQDYVVFLRAVDGKIAFMREYFHRCALPRR